jgi:undecaprenyl diphosphate synthase
MKNVPKHIGIIIDGNRRWAKKRGLPAFEGHRRGFNNFKKISDCVFKKGIKILTIYAFSTENWNRSKKEVGYLMRLLALAMGRGYAEDLNKNGIKLQVIGQRERLPKALQKKVNEIEKWTKGNKKGLLNLAISYGGRPEIVKAVKEIIKKGIPAEKVSEGTVNDNLWTKGLPYPDLIIRTGGEQRLSNFLTWQSAYSELYFTKKYWPAFTEKDLDSAIEDFDRRQRRFGR